MKIEFSKEEYLKLLDMVNIADWVIHSFTTGEGEGTREYRELQAKIFSFAQEYGLDDLVELFEGSYEPTRKFEDESPAFDFIEEYEEEVFWDELIDRLTQRDMEVKHGEDWLDEIFENEELFREYQDKLLEYEEEFEKYGLDRLKLLEDEN